MANTMQVSAPGTPKTEIASTYIASRFGDLGVKYPTFPTNVFIPLKAKTLVSAISEAALNIANTEFAGGGWSDDKKRIAESLSQRALTADVGVIVHGFHNHFWTVTGNSDGFYYWKAA